MAIYCRSSGSLSSTLILCYSKYSSVAQKIHLIWQQSAKPLGDSRRYYHLSLRNYNRNKLKETSQARDKDASSILDIIEFKKSLAKKSMLVHVKMKKHIPELQHMCAKFGEVSHMYQYQNADHQDLVLVEFHNLMAMTALKSYTRSFSQSLAASNIYDFHASQAKDFSGGRFPLTVCDKKSDVTLQRELGKIANEGKSVSKQIEAHYELMRLKAVDEKLRYFVLSQIEDALSVIHPGLAIVPFGSTVNGFGKYNSDLDLALITPSDKSNRKGRAKPYLMLKPTQLYDKSDMRGKLKTSLHLVAEIMPCTVPGIRNMCEILSARVPIIKFKHQLTELSCDLTMDQRAGVCMSELLHVFGQFDVRVRPLVLFIRDWARSRQLTSRNPGHWITNFSLSLLLIFYLQTIKLLPSLKLLTTYARYCDVMEGDDGARYSFLRRPALLPSNCLEKRNESLEELLLGFFKYYANFNFEKHSVCLQTGEPGDQTENAPLFINNPFDIHVNVSKNVTGVRLKILKQHFQDSAIIMMNLKDNTVYENLLVLSGMFTTQSSNEALAEADVNDEKDVKKSSKCL